MNAEARCPTRLLPDTPADKDTFGGHERVASSITEVVQTESGGKAIGLEGGWGSGKSTIVKLISQKLSQTKGRAHRIAVFDMWSHQDDPLRRTFLENLITLLQGFGWVDEEEWNRRIAELAKRRREDTTKVVPRLTKTGVGFAFALLAIPIGSALITAGLSLLGSNDASVKLGAALLSLGLVVALAPAIYFGFLAGVRIWRKMCTGSRGEADGRLSEFPALVMGQATTESRTVVTHTPDPTSVEFESIFRDLLDEALKPKTHKLLLVVDNLDRVHPTDALSIWSTLQTFLGHSDYQQSKWIDRLWVLIPYDGNAILRLWTGSVSDTTNANNSSLATSFLDKTFQLRFRVPPLLLTNWRRFLQEALQLAFPNHQEADFHGVYRAFAAEGGLESSAPTPRDLKIFVNQIGVLHREWQDEFPLSYLACYVLFQKDCKNVREALLANKDFELLSRNIGQEWRGIIAALHFGVSIEEARQLLLRGPIQGALANGDGKTLSNLESTHDAGFWSVLEDTVPTGADDWNNLAPTDLAKAATALANSRIFEHADGRPEAAALRSNIRTAAAAVRAWTPFDVIAAEGIVAVGQLVGDSEEIVSALLAGVSNAVVDATGEEQLERVKARVSPSVWMASALTVIDGFVELGFDKALAQGVKVHLSAEQWLDVSVEVAERNQDGRLLRHLDLEDIAEIDQLLAQRVVPGQIDDNVIRSVQATMVTRSRDGMINTATEVFSHLRSGQVIQGDELAFMLRILRFSRTEGLITGDQYVEFAAGGPYLHHLHQATSESHPKAVGECMFGYLEAVPDASEPDAFGNSTAGYENLNQLLQDPDIVPGAVEHFTTLAEETQQLSAVLEMATGKQPVPPFLGKVLRALLNSEVVPKSVELVRTHWPLIRDVLERENVDSQSLKTFLQRLPGLDNLVSGLVESTFDVHDSGLYVALLKSKVDVNFVTWCSSGPSSVNGEVWAKEIKPQGDLVELIIELKKRSSMMTLGSAYLDSLIEYTRSVAEGTKKVFPQETWYELLSLLDTGQQELFTRRAYETLQKSDGTAAGEFFDLFGDMLTRHDLLANDQTLIDRVCRPILDAGNAKGLTWVANIAEIDPELLTESRDKPAANDFRDRVQRLLRDIPEDDPTLPDLKRIGVVLGIENLEGEDPDAEIDARSNGIEES